jgi:HK97 family phage prohead protease
MLYDTKINTTMRESQKLNFALELKSLEATGRFAGYASVFNIVDNQHDIVLRGAFSQTLMHSKGVKLLWQHQQSEPIGVFDRIFEDDHGLYVEGRLLLDVGRAREAYALLKSGAVNGLSIGYSPLKYRIDAQTGVRQLMEVDLWEVSLVTFPANGAANVTVVKQAEPILSNYEIEHWNRAAKAKNLAVLSRAIHRSFAPLNF